VSWHYRARHSSDEIVLTMLSCSANGISTGGGGAKSRAPAQEACSAALGWQAHSVRGAISGALKEKRGLTIQSEMHDGRGRIYRIV
jgi:hypothetical protein